MLGTDLDQPIGTLVSGPPATCAPLTTLRGAAIAMTDDLVGALLVGSLDDLLGIVSERDLVRGVAEGLDVEDDRVRDVMSEDVATLPVDATIREAALAMLHHEIRHLVVVDRDDHPVGIVSIRDVLAAALETPEPASG